MRHVFTLFCFIILFNNFVFGQKKQFKLLTDTEYTLINDLSLTFKDTIFVISPLIVSSIDLSSLDIPLMISKYGFSKNQFNNSFNDTLLIKDNKYFEVICLDSLIKYKSIKFEDDFRTREGIDLFQSPILYFIEKNYNKRGICYFNKPVFSKRGKYAIVEYWIHCGFLCGSGRMVLMEKINEKWIIIDTLVYEQS